MSNSKQRNKFSQNNSLPPPKPIIQQTRHSRNRLLALLEHPLSDLYHWILVISWGQFLFLVSLFYLALNVVFAFAYITTGDGIANAKPGSFSDAFFFSVQSMSTIGYGAMYPQTIYAQILVTIEVLVGIILVAIGTGLVFARFANVKARVLFSNIAVVCPFHGLPTLMFRVANQRDNRILEARICMSLLKNEISPEGHHLRRFYDLKLLRARSPSFRLSWQVMHPIDEDSPFYGETPISLAELDGELLITLTGLDETFSQTIHARHAYCCRDIFWSMRFVDILYQTDRGKYIVDYQNFHKAIPIDR